MKKERKGWVGGRRLKVVPSAKRAPCPRTTPQPLGHDSTLKGNVLPTVAGRGRVCELDLIRHACLAFMLVRDNGFGSRRTTKWKDGETEFS